MEYHPEDIDGGAYRRSDLIANIENGVESEDYDLVNQISGEQDILRPFEIVEYMDVKRRHSEDPVEQRRWEESLRNYLESISDQLFPDDEVEVLRSVAERLDSNQTDPDEEIDWDVALDSVTNQIDRDDFKNDRFWPTGVSKHELKRLSDSELGKAVCRIASLGIKKRNSKYIEKAILATNDLPLSQKVKLDKLLDLGVAIYSNTQGIRAALCNKDKYLNDAIKAIDNYGSDEEAVLALRSSFDKHVYEYSKKQLELAAESKKRRCEKLTKKAIRAIIDYSSSEERAELMLKELG